MKLDITVIVIISNIVKNNRQKIIFIKEFLLWKKEFYFHQ